MSEWISVEDRLPMHRDKIIAWCSAKNSWFSGYFTVSGDLMWWAIYNGSATDAVVTHWMKVSAPKN